MGMIIVGFILIIGCFLGHFIYQYRMYHTLIIDGEEIVVGILTALVGMVFYIVILLALSAIPSSDYVVKESYELKAVTDKTALTGESFLFSTRIDDYDYYSYLISTPQGITKNKVDVDDAFIHEFNGVPRVDVLQKEYTNKFARWFFTPDAWGSDIYKFYLPEGSVTSNFYKIGVE